MNANRFRKPREWEKVSKNETLSALPIQSSTKKIVDEIVEKSWKELKRVAPVTSKTDAFAFMTDLPAMFNQCT